VKTFEQFAQWSQEVEAAVGDVAEAIGILCFRWCEDPRQHNGDLICRADPRGVAIYFDPPSGAMVLEINTKGAVMNEETGELLAFGVEKLTPGVWTLEPSLNVLTFVHAFVVLYGVPDPAPWERLVIEAHSIPNLVRP
jgi:hypothetical protein